MESIIERSVARSSMTFPCDVTGARSVALVVHGRPDHLFTQAINAGRARLEQLTSVSKVRYGDYPDRRTNALSAITVVSGIQDFSRLEQMKRRVEELHWDPAMPKEPYTDGVP